MFTLSAQFTVILTNLRAMVAAHATWPARRIDAAHDRAHTAFFVAVWTRISRASGRLERLVAQWRAGTLPKPCTSRAGRPYTPSAKPRLPSSDAWLAVRIPGAASFGSQLRHLLDEPEVEAFLKAAPQAARILRPLCRALAQIPLPPALEPAPRKLPQAPAPPRPGRSQGARHTSRPANIAIPRRFFAA